MREHLEALAWFTTILALSIAGLAYLYTKGKDADDLRGRRAGLLTAIEFELTKIDPWVTGWRPEWVHNPPPQWKDVFNMVFPFEADAVSEGALRGPELHFQTSLVESLSRLKWFAYRARMVSDHQRRFFYAQAALVTSIKRKEKASRDSAGNPIDITFSEPLNQDEEIYYQFHLAPHADLTRTALDPLQGVLGEVRTGIARERELDWRIPIFPLMLKVIGYPFLIVVACAGVALYLELYFGPFLSRLSLR